MKHFRLKLFAFVAVLTIGAACSIDEADQYCFNTVATGIEEVTGPATTTVNVPVTFNASFKILSSCGSFSRFSETNGFPKEIVAVVNYEGCRCTQLASTVTKPYTFQSATAGEFILKFIKPDGSSISKTVTVTQ